MLFAVMTTDKEGGLPIRQETRPAHLDYLSAMGDRLKFAGPFTDENDSPTGSLVVFEAGNLEDAKRIAAEDPYAQAGLFSLTEIRPWRWAIKNPETE